MKNGDKVFCSSGFLKVFQMSLNPNVKSLIQVVVNFY